MVAEQTDTLDTDAPPREADGTASGGGIEKLRLVAGTVQRIARSRWFRIAAVVALISLPVLIGLLCQWMWSLPASVTVASGPEGGFYGVITGRLSKEIEARTGNGVDIATVRTNGSLTNLRLLQEGQVDFALYQAGTEEMVNGLESCFALRDENGDGKLTLEEFARPFPLDVFAGLDRDANNSLSRDELQRLLDAVTLLRQRALRDFSSHEVIEDPAIYCFVQICHYVSTKLDAKISRQRLDGRFDELAGSAQREKAVTGSPKKRAKKKTTSRRK